MMAFVIDEISGSYRSRSYDFNSDATDEDGSCLSGVLQLVYV